MYYIWKRQMTVTELIAALEAVRAEAGDLPVAHRVHDGDPWSAYNLDVARVRQQLVDGILTAVLS